MRRALEVQSRRFYDGGVDGSDGQPEIPPNPGSDAQIELIRITTAHGGEEWAMMRRIAYLDRHLGELLVPRATESFRTDLTSVPAVFTWLVPRTGRHLPATLVHDGLVHPPDDVTYVSTEGHVVLRVEADRVLRDALADTGTGLIRRWLIWSAVTAATMLSGAGTGWSASRTWRYRASVALTVVVVAVLGVLATLDLFDAAAGPLPSLPWMGDRSWPVELAGGLAGAIVVPLVLALAWGRFRIAGAVIGVALAVMLHVTVVLIGLTLLYQGLERLVARAPLLAIGLGVVVVGSALGYFLGLIV